MAGDIKTSKRIQKDYIEKIYILDKGKQKPFLCSICAMVIYNSDVRYQHKKTERCICPACADEIQRWFILGHESPCQRLKMEEAEEPGYEIKENGTWFIKKIINEKGEEIK